MKICNQVGETPTMPRIAARQSHRSNAIPTANDCGCEQQGCEHRVAAYYRVNTAIPFVDHIIHELEVQFSGIVLSQFL